MGLATKLTRIFHWKDILKKNIWKSILLIQYFTFLSKMIKTYDSKWIFSTYPSMEYIIEILAVWDNSQNSTSLFSEIENLWLSFETQIRQLANWIFFCLNIWSYMKEKSG